MVLYIQSSSLAVIRWYGTSKYFLCLDEERVVSCNGKWSGKLDVVLKKFLGFMEGTGNQNVMICVGYSTQASLRELSLPEVY